MSRPWRKRISEYGVLSLVYLKVYKRKNGKKEIYAYKRKKWKWKIGITDNIYTLECSVCFNGKHCVKIVFRIF